MSKADEPAFPFKRVNGPDDFGLTKREYFAAMAMQGMLANGKAFSWLATEAVDHADALMAALERKPE